MPNKMLIDASHPEETRVVVVRGQKVEEFDFESANRKQLRGNIYLAKVTRVEPSLEAAFVEYGGNRHVFLACSEIHPDYYQIPVADRQALLEAEAAAPAEEEREEERRRNRRRRRSAERRASSGETLASSEAEAGTQGNAEAQAPAEGTDETIDLIAASGDFEEASGESAESVQAAESVEGAQASEEMQASTMETEGSD